MLHALDVEPISDADQLGTILYILVDPRARRPGIASALLVAACKGFRSQGLCLAEANRRPAAIGAAANHFGPLGMFLAAGFSVHRADTDGSVWVRKQPWWSRRRLGEFELPANKRAARESRALLVWSAA